MSRWIRPQVAKLDPIVLVNVEILNQRVSMMAAQPPQFGILAVFDDFILFQGHETACADCRRSDARPEATDF
jgi:hypothetical protein